MPLAILAIALLPARSDALRGDDQWNFGFRGLRLLEHQSFWHVIWTTTESGLSRGRPLFLGAVTGDIPLELFAGHPSEYHLYIIAWAVVAAAVLWSLVRALTGSRVVAALTIVLLAGAFQFRFYHDALLGYYGGVEVGVTLLLASLLTCLRSLRSAKHPGLWILATVLLFACACAEEQWIDTLFLVHVCLALAEARDRRLVRVIPTAVVGMIFLALGAVVAPQQTATGYQVAPNLGDYVYALARSWVPPLPTSNRLFSQGTVTDWYNVFPLGGSPTPAEWLVAIAQGAVICAAAGVVWIRPIRRQIVDDETSSMALRLAAVGIPLWLVSPALVVVAQKYQVDHTLSRGYLETFAQTMGVVLVIVALLVSIGPRLWARAPRFGIAFATVTAVALGFAAGVDGFNNLRIVALEQPVRHTRDLMENAFRAGVLASIAQRSTLFFSGADTDWYTGTFGYVEGSGESIVYEDSGRVYDVRPDADQVPLNCPPTPAFPPHPCSPPLPTGAWVRVRAFDGGGSVIVAPIDHPTKATFKTAVATRLVVYTERSGTTHPAAPLLTGLQSSGAAWSSEHLHFQLTRTAGDWAIYTAKLPRSDAPVAASLTDPRSPINFEQLAPPDTLAREFGTKQLLP